MMYIQTYCSSTNKQNAKDEQCRMVKINKVTKGHIFGKNSLGRYKNTLYKAFERIKVKLICSIANVVISVKTTNKRVSRRRTERKLIFYKYVCSKKYKKMLYINLRNGPVCWFKSTRNITEDLMMRKK